MFLSIRMRHNETACLCQYYPSLSLFLFLSPSYPLSLKRIEDKVIMLRFSVRQEPFAVTGLLNVFLLRRGLCAVELQWTELLTRKKKRNASFELPAALIIYLVEIVLFVSHLQQQGGLLMNSGMTDRLRNSRVGPNVRIGTLSIHEQELELNWPCPTGC